MSCCTRSSWKVPRRLDISLSGTDKELTRRSRRPGQHGPNNRDKASEYETQLTEKQELRHMYGTNGRQFHMLFIKASKIKEGEHGVSFMALLEQHLDSVVYRLGLVTTRRQARQLVNHGHITVDGKCVDIPSYHVEADQVIGVCGKSQGISATRKVVEATAGRPVFASFDIKRLEGGFTRSPERDGLYPEIDEALVVEYYNQKL